MSKLEIISQENFQGKKWRLFPDMRFCQHTHAVELNIADVPRGMNQMPIGFVEASHKVIPIGLLGLRAGQNLFVGSRGEWAAEYVPVYFRKYPFQFIPDEQNNLHLAFDLESGALAPNGEDGELFIDAPDQPASKIREVIEFLKRLLPIEQSTDVASAALKKSGILTPWEKLTPELRSDELVPGLLHVDEKKLNGLSGEALKALQSSGALMLAYCQLLSEQQLAVLVKRMAGYAPPQQGVTSAGDLLASMSDKETLNFSGL